MSQTPTTEKNREQETGHGWKKPQDETKKKKEKLHFPFLTLEYLMFFSSVPVLVTCKPCSDEDVLMAVCTSDFGKYIYTKHRQVKAVVWYVGSDVCFLVLNEEHRGS